MALDESELRQLVTALDEALAVFNHHEQRLTARQIRIRSYLAVMRQEVLDQMIDPETLSEIGGYSLRENDLRPHHHL